MILSKIILGISLAAPIGPVTIEMIRRGLRQGFLSAFGIRLGGAIGNTICLLAAYFGLSSLIQKPLVMNMICLLGVIFLIYISLKTILKSITEKKVDFTAEPNSKNAILFGLILSIANPVAIIFWLGMFANSMQETSATGVEITGLYGLIENLWIIIGVLLWGLALSFVLSVSRKFINLLTIRIITFFSGLLLLTYGINYGIKICHQIFNF